MDNLCFDFVNTSCRKERVKGDLLSDAGRAAEFFSHHSLRPEKEPGEKALRALASLRVALAGALSCMTEYGRIPEEALRQINLIFSLTPCVKAIETTQDGYNEKTSPFYHDWNWVMFEIASSFSTLLTSGEPGRIRRCENPECGRFFYDNTKSRTKRCCCDTCSSLLKVRRFRSRHKKEN